MRTFMGGMVAFSNRRQPPEKFIPEAARDVFLVAYPRSGTTWISFVAAELLFQRAPKNLTEIGLLVPDVHELPEKSAVPLASQYLIKSHCPLNAVHGFPPYGDYRRVVYLIRDPRDVMLSHYRYIRSLSTYSGGLEEFAMDWAAGRIWPSSWQEHVNSWLAPRLHPAPFELTVVRYEDFVADPIGQTEILAKALGIEVTRTRIEEIVANTSADSMRRRETKDGIENDPEFNFIGPAKAGNWKRLQTQDDGRDAISIVENFSRDAMRLGGYVTSNEASAQFTAAE
jgi:hypothetical protein